MKYDIFISYKRKSLPTANNLYYRLTTRGYSTFFDLEEMGRDNFNTQLLNHIDNAKDVIVILEEGSLDGCKKENWKEEDWFCHEIAYALKKKKNIIPILIGGYQMPTKDFFPEELKELCLKNAPEFNFSYFEAYINKLIEKNYLLSKPNLQEKATSVFKFFSNENCQIFHNGKLVCAIEGMSDEAFYLPVNRKGDFRFMAIHTITGQTKRITEKIDADEERIIDIEWEFQRDPINQVLNQSKQGDMPKATSVDPVNATESAETAIVEVDNENSISGKQFVVDLGLLKFNMIRIEGGEMMIGATAEQGENAESNEKPAHHVSLSTFYIGQFPITQNVWEMVMGYNKSHFKDKEETLRAEILAKIKESESSSNNSVIKPTQRSSNGSAISSAIFGAIIGGGLGFFGGSWLGGAVLGGAIGAIWNNPNFYDECGHYPVENISYDEAQEFVSRLSKMTNLHFSLPTEDEWEYAARGGNKSMKYQYSGSNNLDEVAWYRGNSGNTTHPVGEKKPNELGLYDMSGNVWEWTETPAHSFAMQIARSFLFNESTIYIRRGGSWWHEAKNCRVSRRYASDRTKKTSGLGLRVVIRENVK